MVIPLRRAYAWYLEFDKRQAMKTWAECAANLIAVAAGRQSAELVLKGGTWVNVHSRELLPSHDVAIIDGRFAYCGPDASHCIGDKTQVIDVHGQYMIPGCAMRTCISKAAC